MELLDAEGEEAGTIEKLDHDTPFTKSVKASAVLKAMQGHESDIFAINHKVPSWLCAPLLSQYFYRELYKGLLVPLYHLYLAAWHT